MKTECHLNPEYFQILSVSSLPKLVLSFLWRYSNHIFYSKEEESLKKPLENTKNSFKFTGNIHQNSIENKKLLMIKNFSSK